MKNTHDELLDGDADGGHAGVGFALRRLGRRRHVVLAAGRYAKPLREPKWPARPARMEIGRRIGAGDSAEESAKRGTETLFSDAVCVSTRHKQSTPSPWPSREAASTWTPSLCPPGSHS